MSPPVLVPTRVDAGGLFHFAKMLAFDAFGFEFDCLKPGFATAAGTAFAFFPKPT